MNDDISPDIAALLADTDDLPADLPSLDDIPDKRQNSNIGFDKKAKPGAVDLNVKTFKPVKKFFMDKPIDVFNNPAYYKTALSGENESAQRLHTILSKYLTCKDPKDRVLFRQQIVPVYWEFLKSLAMKMTSSKTPMCKRMFVRYGVALPSLFTSEQKEMFSKAFVENTTDEPIYYLDEWFREISLGSISISATDEVRPRGKSGKGNDEASRLKQLQSKNNGKLQNAENMYTAKENERSMLEAELQSRVEQFCDHPVLSATKGHKEPLTEVQKRMASEINEKLKALLRVDKDIVYYSQEFDNAKQIERELESKLEELPETANAVNSNDFMTEFETVRQMAKMTIGRVGNHFPIFSREFFHCLPKTTGFRENVLSIMAWIESIDPGAFCRVHKNVQNRIVPYVILVPTYGDKGFCWEPFDKYDRVTSRGRIVVPMYPRDLRTAVLFAVADLRWQVAKEKASYYWMEEGLTGYYYQWFDAQKLKGDVKDYFIEDYILWMTKESEGIQKLDKEVRAIFWRFVPFAQSLKDELKVRSPAYQELYQKDINRSMSDGY